MRKIFVWPSYFWEFSDECDEFYLEHAGGDFMVLEIDENWDHDDVERFLLETKPQG